MKMFIKLFYWSRDLFFFLLLPGASLLSNIPMYSCTSHVVKKSTAHCLDGGPR